MTMSPWVIPCPSPHIVGIWVFPLLKTLPFSRRHSFSTYPVSTETLGCPITLCRASLRGPPRWAVPERMPVLNAVAEKAIVSWLFRHGEHTRGAWALGTLAFVRTDNGSPGRITRGAASGQDCEALELWNVYFFLLFRRSICSSHLCNVLWKVLYTVACIINPRTRHKRRQSPTVKNSTTRKHQHWQKITRDRWADMCRGIQGRCCRQCYYLCTVYIFFYVIAKLKVWYTRIYMFIKYRFLAKTWIHNFPLVNPSIHFLPHIHVRVLFIKLINYIIRNYTAGRFRTEPDIIINNPRPYRPYWFSIILSCVGRRDRYYISFLCGLKKVLKSRTFNLVKPAGAPL